MIRRISVEGRRRTLAHRHHLGGEASGAEEVAADLTALHATDPATVYLSVLARSKTTTLDDVAEALYGRRNLIRWMGMRRTLFVIHAEDVPLIQAAVGGPLAAMLRRQLISRLRRNGTEPPFEGDVGAWVCEIENSVLATLRRLGTASGVDLSTSEPRLRHRILPGAPSERPQNLTSPLLTLMSADGAIMRGDPMGPWTSRHHRWEMVGRRWPNGLVNGDPADSRAELARRWLAAYGPASVEDLRWWTGWSKTITKRALDDIETEEVDLHGQPGVALVVNDADVNRPATEPFATLLPALDPTPMGYKHREWFLAVDPSLLFDRAGNIGPTIWWDGEIIGSWATSADGEVRTVIIVDRGAIARAAVQEAAMSLRRRTEGAVITPAARTPSERVLADDHQFSELATRYWVSTT